MPPSVTDDQRLQTAIETRFECRRCGNCCKGDGLVRFGAEEADGMAAALGLTRRQFVKQYALEIGRQRWTLRDRMVDGPDPEAPPEQWCVFLERDADGLYGCRVHEAKPRQCRSFPLRWRNEDSLRTCAGLRTLISRLRREED